MGHASPTSDSTAPLHGEVSRRRVTVAVTAERPGAAPFHRDVAACDTFGTSHWNSGALDTTRLRPGSRHAY
jgi:hypothetical protein